MAVGTRAIRTAVVGLGYFGSFHAKHYAANPLAELVAVVDQDRARAEAAAAGLGATAFADHRDLLGKVDAVSIAVPTSLHHRVAADFIDAGIDLLIEKPITDDPASARDLLERAARKNVLLQVGHIERFSGTFAALRREVKRPLTIDCVRAGPWTGRAADVDVILDLMIHDIDLVLSLAGAPVTDLWASGAQVISKTIDSATVGLSFANGITASLHASRIAPAVERRMRVVEDERVIVADLGNRKLHMGEVSRSGAGAQLPFGIVEVEQVDALGAEIAAFLNSVRTRRPPVVDGRAGAAALELAGRIRSEILRAAPAEKILVLES